MIDSRFENCYQPLNTNNEILIANGVGWNA